MGGMRDGWWLGLGEEWMSCVNEWRVLKEIAWSVVEATLY